jgi:hypothetical protein
MHISPRLRRHRQRDAAALPNDGVALIAKFRVSRQRRQRAMPSSADETLENRTLFRAPKRNPPVGSLGARRSAEKRVTPFRGSFLQFIVSIHIS